MSLKPRPLPTMLAAIGMLAGCATSTLPPWHTEPLLATLPTSCTADAAEGTVVPGGLAVVRSGAADVVLVAARGCLFTVDAASGTAEPLPTRGDSIAPTMVDVDSNGLAVSSALSGSVRSLDAAGAVTFNVSGLQTPLGLRLAPGGAVLVAEYGAGTLLRLGPGSESRPRLLAEGLEGPVGVVLADPATAYVTEALAGRVTLVRLDRYERRTLASGIARPEGLALLPDGRLAVVEAGLGRLLAIDRTNGHREVLADGLPVAESTATPAVADVAVTPDGRVFVSAATSRTVLRVVPRGVPQ
ncbi:MAG: hypothetical protein IT486_05305 [Gammaproteobacteria bacterium]|nr:hypothetical protein [Gammaproteobacteria bacterium]